MWSLWVTVVWFLLLLLLVHPSTSFSVISTRQPQRQRPLSTTFRVTTNSRHVHHHRHHVDINKPNTKLEASSLIQDVATSILTAASSTTTTTTMMMVGVDTDVVAPTYQPGVDTAIFVAGLFPFVWATWEFWRRIAVGAPFGTGRDSIRIPSPWAKDDDDDDKESVTTTTLDMNDDEATTSTTTTTTPRRRVLDKGSLITAYVLFAVAGAAVALTLYSVVTSAPLPAVLVTADAVANPSPL